MKAVRKSQSRKPTDPPKGKNGTKSTSQPKRRETPLEKKKREVEEAQKRREQIMANESPEIKKRRAKLDAEKDKLLEHMSDEKFAKMGAKKIGPHTYVLPKGSPKKH